jgi:hypothetical protein
MQASTAMKEGETALNWRQKKKLAAAKGEALRFRQQVVDDYAARIGAGARTDRIVMRDIERVADLELLTREMRAAVRLGTAKVSDLTRLEGAADRARRRLNLPAPNAAAPSDDAWRKFLASQHAATNEGDGNP